MFRITVTHEEVTIHVLVIVEIGREGGSTTEGPLARRDTSVIRRRVHAGLRRRLPRKSERHSRQEVYSDQEDNNSVLVRGSLSDRTQPSGNSVPLLR